MRAGKRENAVPWLRFNAVGALGIGVQLAVLLGLRSGFHLSYLLATALAVEAAVVHNFLWHERYTWADRVQPSWRKSPPRLLRFNLATGGVSIAGNLALMKVLVGLGRMNYLVASGIAIAVCSLVNFLVSDRVVFALVLQSKESDELPKESTQRLENHWLDSGSRTTDDVSQLRGDLEKVAQIKSINSLAMVASRSREVPPAFPREPA